MKSPSLAYCIEVSARGIAFTRSFARPYVAEKSKRAWWAHDERREGGRHRKDEWFAPAGIDPKFLHNWARERATTGFLICAVAKNNSEQAQALAKYKTLGYRLWRTEALMACSTSVEPSREINTGILPVDTEPMISRLTEAAGGRMILPEHLKTQPARVRCHVAMVDDRLVGWIRSISIADASWCASLFVQPEFRRRGIGQSLVATMLQADRDAGSLASILIASHAGAKLYRSIGYRMIGNVLVLNPPR